MDAADEHKKTQEMLQVTNRVVGGIGAHLRRAILGRDEVIEFLLIALLSDGHVLLEDFPGSGKTTLAKALGGYEVAGIIHRAMGVVTFGYFAMHLAFVAYIWISGKMKLKDILWGPRSIVPHPQDGIDIANNIKWFLFQKE